MTYRPNCPIPDCNRTVSKGKLMCPHCWSAVPPYLQQRVYRTYRAWMRDMGNADKMLEYKTASDAAIESV